MGRKFVEGNDWRNVANALDEIVAKMTDDVPSEQTDDKEGRYINDIRRITDDLLKIADTPLYSGPEIDALIDAEDEKISGKVDVDQGTDKAGKVLAVGSDGSVTTVPAGTAGVTDAGNVAYVDGTGYTSGSVGAAMEAAEDDIGQLKSEITQLDDSFDAFIDGTPVGGGEAVPHTGLVYGSYASGDDVGTPTGGGGQTRACCPLTFSFDVLNDEKFVFNSNGTCNISFLGFTSGDKCNSTPSAWLTDGQYTKSEVLSNCRGTTDSVKFSFQVKKTDGSNVPALYADDYASISAPYVYIEIDTNSVKDDAITEEKLSAGVREKLNGPDKTVDVIMFMGQSNMAGRGEVANAPTIISGAGYEYRAISAPNTLTNMAEPFGATESNPDGINEGNAKTGSMVVAFTNAYYKHNGGIPVVGISASKGGTSISEWQPDGAYLDDAIARLSSCVSYLTTNGYTIRHKYMLICIGETDGDLGTTAEDFKSGFDTMLAEMIEQGIEKCFLVRIGNYNYQTSDRYEAIMDCQTEIAQTEPNVVMASTDFAGMRARGLMKDAWHYYQAGYNEVGTYAGINVALYEQTGKEPTMYDTQDGTLYYTHKN